MCPVKHLASVSRVSESLKSAAPVADGRDRRWNDHRQARRDHLLETAIALIDAEGVGVGVAAIAAAAEVPRSVVYKLFKDREDLDDQIRQRIAGEVRASILATLKSRGSIRRLLSRGVDRYVSWVVAHPNLHRFLAAGSTTAPVRNTVASLGGAQSFALTVQELVEIAWGQLHPDTPLPAGVARHLTHGAVGFVDSVVNPWLGARGGRKTSKAYLVEFLTDGLCGLVEAAGRMAGADVDVDAVIKL